MHLYFQYVKWIFYGSNKCKWLIIFSIKKAEFLEILRRLEHAMMTPVTVRVVLWFVLHCALISKTTMSFTSGRISRIILCFTGHSLLSSLQLSMTITSISHWLYYASCWFWWIFHTPHYTILKLAQLWCLFYELK